VRSITLVSTVPEKVETMISRVDVEDRAEVEDRTKLCIDRPGGTHRA
jgi:hypothetical protein